MNNLNPTQQRIYNHLMFGEMSIDEIWKISGVMPQTVSRELREMENVFKIITPTKFGKRNAKIAYKLTK